MADGIESFNEAKNLARVTAGLSEQGPYYKTLNTVKPMNFVDGYPKLFEEKRKGESYSSSPIIDVWNARRANGNIK